MMSPASRRHKILLPILVGGAVAGIFDLTAAFIDMGWGVPRSIAAGWLGRQAIHGGIAVWILGVVLHFVVAYSAAAIYCLSSLKLKFLKDNFLICGMFYGIAIWMVMNLIVLPLSAYHFTGPYKYHGMVQGLLIHMFLIGLPIAFSLKQFSK